MIPRQVKLLAYYTVTYACDHCEKDTGFAHIANVKPPVPLMKQHLLEQTVIHADETVAQVLKEDGKPATSVSRMWLYASGEYSKQNIRKQKPTVLNLTSI